MAVGGISGTVTSAVTSDPISGATMTLYRNGNLEASTTTAFDGTYSFAGLSPGNYELQAAASSFQTQIKGVRVRNNLTTLVDFSLEINPGTIAGTVINSATDPIFGALVEVSQGGILIGSDTTAVDGTYSIGGLPPGSYVVTASAASYQTLAVGASVTGGAITTVDFELASNPGIISGTVTDTNGSPLQSVLVQVIAGGATIASGLTDSSGNYLFSGIAPGSYTVSASKTLYQTQVVGVSVSSDTTTIANFSLAADPGIISGTVTAATGGGPLVSVLIQVILDNIVIATGLTDDNGEYSVGGLAPGSYAVRAGKTGYQTSTTGAIVASGSVTTVNFSLAANPGAIAGTITDSVTTAPIAGATIAVRLGGSIIFMDITDDNGNYSIEGVAPGSYTVSASKSGYQTNIVGAIVTAGTTTLVDLALSPNPGEVSGIVTDLSTGTPIAGATVEILDDNIFITSTLTESNGAYQISGLTPGSYIMHVHASGYQLGVVGAVIESGQTTTVNFSLESNPATVEGTVISTVDGLPIAGTLIEVIEDSFILASTLTDSSGAYSITGLFSGTFTMHAHATNYQTGAENVTLTAGHTTTVNFSLASNPAAIQGTVVATDTLAPLPGTLIEIHSNFINVYFTLTDNLGNYSLTGLPVGTVAVHAHNPDYQTGIGTAVLVENTITTLNFSLASDPAEVTGIISDAMTSLPIPGAFVRIQFVGSTPLESDLTDSNGLYELHGLSPGNFTVTAAKSTYVANSSSVFTLVAGELKTLNISLYSSNLPPQNLTGKVILNRFLLQVDRIHYIQWTSSVSPEVVLYRVYRNDALLSTIAANQPLFYEDHNRSKNVTDIYRVTAINSNGSESSGPTIALR